MRDVEIPLVPENHLTLFALEGGYGRFGKLFRRVWRRIGAEARQVIVQHWRKHSYQGLPFIEYGQMSISSDDLHAQVTGFGADLYFNSRLMDGEADRAVEHIIAHELAHVYRLGRGLLPGTETSEAECGLIIDRWGYDRAWLPKHWKRLDDRKVDRFVAGLMRKRKGGRPAKPPAPAGRPRRPAKPGVRSLLPAHQIRLAAREGDFPRFVRLFREVWRKIGPDSQQTLLEHWGEKAPGGRPRIEYGRRSAAFRGAYARTAWPGHELHFNSALLDGMWDGPLKFVIARELAYVFRYAGGTKPGAKHRKFFAHLIAGAWGYNEDLLSLYEVLPSGRAGSKPPAS